MVGRTTVSSRGSTGSESFVLIWVHFLNSVGCRFNNQRRGLFLGRVRHQRTVLRAAGPSPHRVAARTVPWPLNWGFLAKSPLMISTSRTFALLRIFLYRRAYGDRRPPA